MGSTKDKGHTLKEWEEAIKHLPFEVEFKECELGNGRVIRIVGHVILNGKKIKIIWVYNGKSFYKCRRIDRFDIPFKKVQ